MLYSHSVVHSGITPYHLGFISNHIYTPCPPRPVTNFGRIDTSPVVVNQMMVYHHHAHAKFSVHSDFDVQNI